MSESSYIVKKNGAIVCILCKLCGCPIRGLVPVGEPIDTRKNGNMVIRDNKYMLGVGSNYKQVVLEIVKTDKKGKIVQRGKHVTCICSECLNRANTQDLQKIYLEDIQQFKLDGMDNMGIKALMEWKPTRIIGEEQV